MTQSILPPSSINIDRILAAINDPVGGVLARLGTITTEINVLPAEIRQQIEQQLNIDVADIAGIVSAAENRLGSAVVGEASQLERDLQDTENFLATTMGVDTQQITSALHSAQSQLQGQIDAALAGIEADVNARAADVINTISADTVAVEMGVNDHTDQAFNDIVGNIADQMAPLADTVDALGNSISDNTQTIGEGLAHVETGIVDQLAANEQDASLRLLSIQQAITTDIGGAIEQILPSFQELFTPLLDKVRAFIDAVASGDIAGRSTTGVINTLIEQFPNITVPLVTNSATASASGIGNTLLSVAVNQLFMPFLPEIDSLLGKLRLPQEAYDFILKMRGGNDFFRVAVAILVMPAILGAGALLLLKPFLERTRQEIEAQFPYNMLTASEIVAAGRRQLSNFEAVSHVLRSLGLDDAQAAGLWSLSETLQSPDNIIEAWRRSGMQPDPNVDLRLKQMGLEDNTILELKALATHMPTPQDMVLFLVREVFDRSVWEPFGQHLEYPDSATPEFARLGIDEDLARNYWKAHWQLPSIDQAIHMHQRTTYHETPLGEPIKLPGGKTVWTILSTEHLERLMRAHDMMPFWRPPFTELQYHPLTRVDVRRMHKVGILDPDDVVKAYLDLGYNLENAVKLRDFVLALNSQEHKDAIEPFRSGLKGQIVSHYEANRLSEHAAHDALHGLNYTDEQVAAFLAEAAFIRDANEHKVIIDGIKRYYVASKSESTDAVRLLTETGLEHEPAARMVASWDIERQFRELTADEKHQRDLTKAEIIALYEDQLSTEAETADLLQHLGYDEHESTALIHLADYKRTRAEVNAQRDRIHTLYVANRIDRVEASTELDTINVSPAHKEALLAKWDTEHESKVAHIPLNIIEQLVKQQVITADEARPLLEQLGYDEVKINWLLRLFGAITAAQAARLQATTTRETEAAARRVAAERAKAEREAAAAAARAERAKRKLTHSEVLRMLRVPGTSRETVQARLVASGYSDADAETLLRELEAANNARR